jgi:hypothetical protein
MSGNPDNNPQTQTMRVAAAGQIQDFTFDTGGHGWPNLGWTPHTFTFTATGSSTILSFASLDGPGDVNGALLDNVTVIGARGTNEDTPLTLTGLSISDVDAGADLVQVSLGVAHGVLALGSTAGLSASGLNSAAVTLTGTQSAINAALASGLTYTPAANYNGDDTLSITANDQGHNGSGGAQSATRQVAITVAPVNDAPVDHVPGGQTVNEDTDLVFTGANAITISDVDGGSGDETVTLTVGGGTLALGSTLGLTSFTNNAATITLTGTVAHINAALDGLSYRGNLNFNGPDTLDIITHDNGNTGGGDLTGSASVAISVSAVNDAPVVTAGHTLNYTENQAATAIDAAIAVSDVDSANLASATLQITGNYVNGEDVLAFANTATITGTFHASSGTLTLTGSDSVANYQAALRSVTYVNTSDDPSGLARAVTIITSDGAASSAAVTDTINVTPVNDAPMIDGGDTRSVSVDENTTAVPGVVAQDPDGPSLNWSVVTGSGSPDASKFTIDPGTGALSFKNAPDFGHPTDSNHNNIYTVQVNVTDGTLSDTQTLFVHVTDVNDNAPVITTGAFQFVAENHTFVTQLSAFDVDSVGGPTTFTIADGLDGNLFQIDVNGNLQFATAPDFEHPADSNRNNIYSVTVNASDGLNSSSKTLFVQVTNVNEAPVLAPDSATVTYTENAAALALMAGGTVTDPDNPSNFDDGSVSVTLNGAVSGDELALASTGGVSISGTSVKVGSTTIGTISGNHSTHLTVDFNANATDPRVETLLRALAFDSTSDNPTGADRTATITFNDGSNDGSGPALSDSSMVTIHVTPVNDAPHAVDDTVITNNVGNSTYKIPEWVLLANDTDPDSAVLDVTLISSASGFLSVNLTSNPGKVTITDNASVGGSFIYTASDGSSTDTAHVTVTQDTGTMNGGSGSEIFIGDSSGSTINGNAGNDILIGNGGDDTLDGGPGNDTYVFGLADGRDTIAHSSGIDTIRIEAGGAALTGLSFAEDTHDNLVIQFNGQQITLTNQFDDSTVGALQFNGGASYAGYDLGGNLYSLSDDGGTTRNGTSGNDILAGDAGGNTISGGDGKDLLFGSAGNDTLNGGSGNDLLVGGAGNDFMSGGPGNDTFVFAAGSGRDIVSDFIPGQDQISLDYHAFNAGDFGSWLTSHASSVNSGHDVLIDLNVDGLHPGVDTILLQNVGAVANLHVGDFIVH